MGVKFSVEDTRFGTGKNSRGVKKLDAKPVPNADIEVKTRSKGGISLKFAEIGGKVWWDLRGLQSALLNSENYVAWGKLRLEPYAKDVDYKIVPLRGKREVLVTSGVARSIAESEHTEAGNRVRAFFGCAADAKAAPEPVSAEAGIPQIFTFEANEVRVVIRDNEPWWVLSDVCHVLGILNPRDVANRLDSDQKSTVDLNYGGNGSHSNTIINESGLYAVIFRSDKPEAKRFQKWVFSEVLPHIHRKPQLTPEAKTAPQEAKPATEAQKTVDVAIVPIQWENNGEGRVDARELWNALGSRQDFSTWFKAKITNFTPNEDFGLLNGNPGQSSEKASNHADFTLHKVVERENGGTGGGKGVFHKVVENPNTGCAGKNRKDFWFAVDAAKEVCMMEQTETGRNVGAQLLAYLDKAVMPVEPQKVAMPQIFTFETREVRVIILNGEPWWVLSDVCGALCLSNATMVADRLPEIGRSKFNLGRQGEATIINEAALYRVIFRSDKPEAKRFQDWVFNDVLPQIRKTGTYGATQPSLTREQKVAEAFLISQEMLADAKQKVARLEAKTEEFKFKLKRYFAPHLEMISLLSKPNSGFLMSGRECAKFLELGFSDVTLYKKYLRPWGWLCKDSTEPTQYAIDRGWMAAAYSVSKTPDKHGGVHGSLTPKFTYRGVLAVLKRMIENGVKEYSDSVKAKEATLLKCLKENVAIALNYRDVNYVSSP